MGSRIEITHVPIGSEGINIGDKGKITMYIRGNLYEVKLDKLKDVKKLTDDHFKKI